VTGHRRPCFVWQWRLLDGRCPSAAVLLGPNNPWQVEFTAALLPQQDPVLLTTCSCVVTISHPDLQISWNGQT
jgi:hypothetical protein